MSAYDTVYAHMVRLRRQEAGQDGWELTDALEKVLAVLDAAHPMTLNSRLVPDPAMAGKTDCYAVPLDDLDDLTKAYIAATEDNGP